MAKKWIKGAINPRHKGSLDRWARKHRLMDANGDIDLRAAQSYLDRHPNLHRQRQLNLARNLRHLHHRGRE
jgi:hypothetical protein